MNWKDHRGLIADVLDLAVRLLAILEETSAEYAITYATRRSALYDLRVQALRGHNSSAAIWLNAAGVVEDSTLVGPAEQMLAIAIDFAEEMAETEHQAEIARAEAEEKRKRAEEEAATAKAEAQAEAARKEADRKAAEVKETEDKKKSDRDAREQRRAAAEKTRKEEADRIGNDKAVIEAEKAAVEADGAGAAAPADSSG